MYGLSNPRTFTVGDRKEINETEPNNTLDKAEEITERPILVGQVALKGEIGTIELQHEPGLDDGLAVPAAEVIKPLATAHAPQDVDLTRQQFPQGAVVPEGQPKTKGHATTRDLGPFDQTA